MESLLWERVGELADRAPQIEDLRHHKLHLIAASRMRARGEVVPAALVEQERVVAATSLLVPSLLRRIRNVCEGPIVLMKGAELAARWPQSRLRPAKDLDLLVSDADAMQAALLMDGFLEIEDPNLYRELHHHCPLFLPGLPLTVEVHHQPHWGPGTPPETAQIIGAAQPSVLQIDGILAPRPDHHVVLLAVHAWAHTPLDRISLLADIAAMLQETTPEAAARVAGQWGVAGIWRATLKAIDDFLLSGSIPGRAPVWKRHLADARERTVFEEHITRIVAPATVAPMPSAPLALLAGLANAIRPYPEEQWRAKLRRSAQALRHAAWSRSRHEAALEPDAAADDRTADTASRGDAALTFAE